MPSLICSSRYTIDSQILRQTARDLGWETLRLDGNVIPNWFDPPDDQIAFFYTPPHAFDIARQLGRQLVGCNPDWTCRLPRELLLRELQQTSLSLALTEVSNHFVKHAVSKAFRASVYNKDSLAAATEFVHGDALVHIGEPVSWTHEFRCFVANRTVQAISPYIFEQRIVADGNPGPEVSEQDLEQARSFARQVIEHPAVATPAAFVLDVGLIAGRGWAVVECNECWAAGIYGCDPSDVLNTLLCGSVANDKVENQWDFSQHYLRACP